MLIMTRGGFALGRTALVDLSAKPSEMRRFSSSIPIQKCDRTVRIVRFMRNIQRCDPNVFELMYMPEGGTDYTFTRVDLLQWKLLRSSGKS
jgi:hypothetical protein